MVGVSLDVYVNWSCLLLGGYLLIFFFFACFLLFIKLARGRLVFSVLWKVLLMVN